MKPSLAILLPLAVGLWVARPDTARAGSTADSPKKTAARKLREKVLSPPRRDAELSPAERLAVMLDERSQEVIRQATEVELIRLQSHPAHPSSTLFAKHGEPAIDGFAIERRAMAKSQPLLAKLKATALSPEAYLPYQGNKFCGGFEPKAVFRFGSGPGSDSVYVLLCFNCVDVGVIRAGQAPQRLGTAVVADMGKAEGAWLALVKEAFPEDAFLQATEARPREEGRDRAIPAHGPSGTP